MRHHCLIAALTLAGCLPLLPALAAEQSQATPSASELLAKSRPAEWRHPDPHNLLVMQLTSGRVVIELAPHFTPLHAANIRTLVREHYFDGLAVIRVQDNFVTQWGAPEDADNGYNVPAKSLGTAKLTLPPEYTRTIDPKQAWTALPDGDVYAPQVGFSDGFPVARDPASGQEWLPHCYGMVGVARDNGPETGNGSSLYAVIGQAPRRLDRNLAIAGRVLEGMPLLSGLPRGTAPMGFYAEPAQRVTIKSAHMDADVPTAQRVGIEVLRTDSATFAALIAAQRNRHDAFYQTPASKIGVCDISAPVRMAKPAEHNH
ncbi:MAG: peptidylprolyl isomerase [Rhodanobacter sp.]